MYDDILDIKCNFTLSYIILKYCKTDQLNYLITLKKTLDNCRLDDIRLDWIRLDWIGLDWIGFVEYR